jgi:integrase
LPAIRFYVENFREPSIRIALSEALNHFLESKKASNIRPDTFGSLEYKVGSFVAKHAEKSVCAVTPIDITTEIHRPGLSPVSKSNVRRALHALFEWCTMQKPQAYCFENPVKSIDPIKVDRDKPQILPLDSVKRLVQVAEAHKQGLCIPYVALGLFCAIRPTDLTRLSWNEIDIKTGTVTIGAKLAKMRRRRIVEIPKNALQFLSTHASDKTPIKGKNWRIHRAVRRVLTVVLGTPKASVWDTIKLALRNTVKPSRVLRMTYSIPSIIESGRMLDIVVEANVTERNPHLSVVEIPFSFSFRDKSIQTQIKGYDIHEMPSTKMRAMFQRKRGRDLFDLYWALGKHAARIILVRRRSNQLEKVRPYG